MAILTGRGPMTPTPDQKRSAVFFWPTWLAGLFSGDDHCRYAAWYKGHFKYTKVPQTEADLTSMRGHMQVHEEGLQAEAARLQASGAKVYIEDANAFTVRGNAADLAGKMDLISVTEDAAEVVDVKGGRKYDKHVAQVILYLLFGVRHLPHVAHLAGKVSGRVHYTGGRGDVLITPEQAEDMRPRYVRMIQELAAETPPPAAPSKRGCQFCDIAHCQYRFTERPVTDAPPPGF